MRLLPSRGLALAVIGAIGLMTVTRTASANVEVGVTAGPHTFNQHLELGVEDRNDAESLRNSVFFGVRFAFMFNDMLGVEAEAGGVPTEGRGVVFDVWTAVARAQLVAQFMADNPAHKVVPFVLVGAGAIQVVKSDNLERIAKDTDPEFYAGIGAKYRVEGGWGLRLDVRGLIEPSSKVKDDGVTSDDAPVFDLEVLLGVYREFGRKEAPKAVTHEEKEPEVGDADGDGIKDDVDECKTDAEDADGYQDDDGCPDLDNDGDGINDTDDQCKSDPEDKDGYQDEDGCPDPDNDSDGILDDADQCKGDAEDKDNFQDEDGCPDPDNDGDGVLDGQDQCADQMETHNGYKDDDGCADDIPKAVQKFTGVIKGINFKNDSAEILKSSFKTLDAAVKVLKDYPDLKMEISGHTDDTGEREHNMDLSQKRAESVKAYFVSKGIEDGRLVAKGYGPDKPLVNAKTKAARAKNRRVEFQLISDLDTAAPADAGGATP
jgi:OOP family OmpA-OmpF porin